MPPFALRRRIARRWLVGIFVLTVCGLGLIFGVTAYVSRSVPPLRTTLASVPPMPIAIVFGAGVTRDGRPTAALADRINAAALLYQTGQVSHILLTGDNSSTNYDEVTVMQRWAEQQGVPSAALTLDYAGFRTYDSCYRAHAIFGITRAVLVTQRYHLPRALYTCQQLGIEGIGLAADQLPDSYSFAYRNLLPAYTQRERLALVLMLWEIHITQPLPRFLGPQEPIKGLAG